MYSHCDINTASLYHMWWLQTARNIVAETKLVQGRILTRTLDKSPAPCAPSINATKTRSLIDMCIHMHSWSDATLRFSFVCTSHTLSCLPSAHIYTDICCMYVHYIRAKMKRSGHPASRERTFFLLVRSPVISHRVICTIHVHPNLY